MPSPRWKKILRDLGTNKTRTLLVVLSIAVGVFAVGVVTLTFSTISAELSTTYPSYNPALATVSLDLFDQDLVKAVSKVPGVEDVEPRTVFSVRVLVAPDTWKQLLLYAIPDYNNIRINKVVPQGAYEPAPWFEGERGQWPPQNREVALERSSLLVPGLVPPNVKTGDLLEIEAPGGARRQLRVSGLAHEGTNFPAPFMSVAYGYVTMDTLEWLTGTRLSNQMYVTVTGDKKDINHIKDVAEQVRAKIESSGRTVSSVSIPIPGRHPVEDIFQGILLILNSLGYLSLILSGFLVVNTISALLAQQTRQIGMMKAIGARAGQIFVMYLSMVLLFGVLAVAIAIPASAFVSERTTQFLAGFVNVDFPHFVLPVQVVVLEIAIGILIPLLAAIFPIWSGTRVSVREAISDYGIGQGPKRPGLIDRLLEHVRGVSRPVLISLRNTFRKKARLTLTLLTLILGGTIFIGVLNAQASMQETLVDALKNWRFDVLVQFAKPYRTDLVEQEAWKVPGVVAVESWGINNARRVRPDGTESEVFTFFAPPPNTKMMEPTIVEGRWLVPEDENALVVATNITQAEKDLKLGDEITLKVNDQKSTWHIVGIVRVIGRFGAGIGNIYANYPYYTRVLDEVGRTGSVQVVTDGHDAAYQDQISKALEAQFKSAGLRPAGGITSGQIKAQNDVFFNILVTLLLIMAVLMAFVGGLGLMGTMSLNVLERTREIGVMRAIGASNGSIRGIVMVEGILIGMISAAIGALLSIPLGKLMVDALGVIIFQMPLSYKVSIEGIIIWFVLVFVLATLSSLLPAQRATGISVREVLAYE